MSNRKCVICLRKKPPGSNLLFTALPLDPFRCRSWVQEIGQQDLVHLPIEKLHELKFVCGNHFAPEHLNKQKNRIRKHAVPMLNLTRPRLPDELFVDFPLRMAKGQEIQIDPTDRKESTAELPLSETNFDEEHITDSESLPDVVKPVCQICLSTDFESIDTDSALVDFYDELVYYEALVSEPQFCPLCQHFLKKSYNFRQKCRRAHILLHEWVNSDAKDRRPLDSLHSYLPTSTVIGVCTPEANFQVFDCESASLEAETVTDDESIHSKEQLNLGQVENYENGREDTEEVEPDVRTYFEEFLDTNVDFTDIKNEDFIEIEIDPKIVETNVPIIKHEQQAQRKENYAQSKLNRIKSNFKECVLLRMDKGELNNIEDQGTVLTKEIFLDFIEKASIKGMKNAMGNTERLRMVLLRLLKRYNPVYECMFETEFLDTPDKVLEEFNNRKDTKLYLEATYTCELCYKVFESQAYLDYHKQWHDPEKKFPCDICSMRFETDQKMLTHKSKYHYVIYRCKLCHYYSPVRNVMKHHYKEHMGRVSLRGRSRSGIPKATTQFVCSTCGKLFESADILHRHEIAMHRARQFVCTLCGRDFATERGLQSHTQLKHEDSSEELSTTPTEQCKHCAASFHRREALNKHALTLHSLTDTDMYKCSCGAVFPDAEELNSHRSITRHKVKPQSDLYKICTICDEILPGSILYQHFKSAHPSESYVYMGAQTLCELCGKSFKLRSQYLDHMNAHTGTKPYECSECGQRFALRKHAIQHLQRHGDPKYRCAYCDKLFHTKRTCTIHQKIHFREDKHRCKVCSETLSSAAALKSHIDGVHSILKRERKPLASRKMVFQNKIVNAYVKQRRDGAES